MQTNLKQRCIGAYETNSMENIACTIVYCSSIEFFTVYTPYLYGAIHAMYQKVPKVIRTMLCFSFPDRLLLGIEDDNLVSPGLCVSVCPSCARNLLSGKELQSSVWNRRCPMHLICSWAKQFLIFKASILNTFKTRKTRTRWVF